MARSGVTQVYHQLHRFSEERGTVLLLVTVLVLIGSIVIVAGLSAILTSQMQTMQERRLALYTHESAEGMLEEVAYRHMNALQISASEVGALNGASVITTTTNIPGGIEVRSDATMHTRVRSVEATLLEGDGASFNFGVQTDNGGFILENNSSVTGNIYSNGSIVGHGLNMVRGTAISAGSSGYISEIHATGSMYAHDIEDSYIEGDAFYQTIDVSTTVDGTKFAGSPDLGTTSLPITDTLLDSWEAYAASTSIMSAECIAAGGTIIYDYDVTLGPAKIPCDVEFSKFPDVTISGVVWIEGDLTFKQGANMTIDPAIGNKSVPIIVDDPSDRLTSGRVTMENSGAWSGNGNRSYLLVVSRNESAEQGGGETAIRIKNSTGGALLVYTNHGEVALENNTSLTEISAWRVRLQNNTEVLYDTGLASAIFTAGPGGSYTIDSWKEVQ